MRKGLWLSIIALFIGFQLHAQEQGKDKKYLIAGIAFYNLENLFDTINNNGKYDYEFSPEGPRMWDSEKYWKKLDNLSRAITALATPETPLGPAIIGISEVENRSVVEDLVKKVDETLTAEGKDRGIFRLSITTPPICAVSTWRCFIIRFISSLRMSTIIVL